MDLRAYVRLLGRRWPVFVVAFVVVTAAIAGASSFLIPPTYEATAQVFLTVNTTTADATLSDRRNAALGVQDQIKTYAQLVTTNAVLIPVIGSLHLDTTVPKLAHDISVSVPADTSVLQITATDGTAQGAADLANALAKQIPLAISSLKGTDTGDSTIVAQTMAPALPPESKASPNLKLNFVIAVLIGLFVAIAAAVLVDNFDNRVRRGTHLQALGLHSFGGIPLIRGLSERQMLEYGKRLHGSFTAYRRVAIDLLFAAGTSPTTILFTATRPGSGKTTTASNIASALAEAGNNVVFVDADLRGGRLAPVARIPQLRGVSDVVSGRSPIETAVTFWKAGNFAIMPAGASAIDPFEMLASEQMSKVLATLEKQFDVIIIDAPPVVGASDASMLARSAKNIVLVVEAGVTRRAEATRVATAFARGDSALMGAVLNKSSAADVAGGAPNPEEEA